MINYLWNIKLKCILYFACGYLGIWKEVLNLFCQLPEWTFRDKMSQQIYTTEAWVQPALLGPLGRRLSISFTECLWALYLQKHRYLELLHFYIIYKSVLIQQVVIHVPGYLKEWGLSSWNKMQFTNSACLFNSSIWSLNYENMKTYWRQTF